jgi:hypothetical protein
MIPELTPVSSGFAVVMAEAPNETAYEEAAAIPRMSHTSLCWRKLQRLITPHKADWTQLCLHNQA